MSCSQKKVIIIGLGNIGFSYDKELPKNSYVLTHSRAFHLHPNFNIIGGVDKQLINRNAFHKIYSTNVYTNINEALKDNKPDVVVIATPAETHFQLINEVFKLFSPEFIVCEKPLGHTLNDSKKIISLCKKNNSKIYVNYMRNSS